MYSPQHKFEFVSGTPGFARRSDWLEAPLRQWRTQAPITLSAG